MTSRQDELFTQVVEQQRSGKLVEAVAGYRQLLRLDPGQAEATLRLSELLRQQGEHVAAARELARAAKQQPKNAAILFEIGSLLQSLAQHDRALTHFKRVVALDPRHLQALIYGGDCWLALSRADRACDWYRRALHVQPTSISARNNLGSALQALGQLDDAIAEYRLVLQDTPHAFETRVNLATALHEMGDSAAALGEIRAAIEWQPNDAKALTNLGVIHEDLGQFAAALAAYDRALAVAPQNADAHLHRALLLVQRERFAEGWDEYEWRFATRTNQRPRRMTCPAWDGSSLAGRHILVHAEQGIGDEMMFATCLPDLIAQAERVSLTCDRRLEQLLRRSFPRATVLGVDRGKEDWPKLSVGADCHLPAGSLPRFLRRLAAAFPKRPSLLVPDPARVQQWKSRLRSLGQGLKVGISWRGGADSRSLDGTGQGPGYRARARRRSCELREWSDLLSVPGVQFISLQHMSTTAEREAIAPMNASRFHTFDELDLRNDFDELAALVASLDLVISVGNAAVHLAGAVGTPTWALLPRFWGWRWLCDRSDCLWYPRVRLWRQQKSGDWQELLVRIRGALAALANQQALACARPTTPIASLGVPLSAQAVQPASSADFS